MAKGGSPDGWKQLQRELEASEQTLGATPAQAKARAKTLVLDLKRQGETQARHDRVVLQEYREGRGPLAEKMREQLRSAGIQAEKSRQEPVSVSGQGRPAAMPVRHVWNFYSNAARKFVGALVNANDADMTRLRERKGTRARFILAGESDTELCALRDELRQHWNSGTLDSLAFRLASRPHRRVEHNVVTWHEFTDRKGVRRSVPILLDVQRAVAIALLEIAPNAGVCANPDCPAPYFVRNRSTQRFCEAKCAEYGQRQHKRDWWKEHGEDWRRSKRKTHGGSLKQKR